MALIKVACPHCGRHYTVDEGERNDTFECLSCEQSFMGMDAIPIGRTGRNRAVRVLLVVTLLMLAANALLWIRLLESTPAEAEINAVEVVPTVSPADFAALTDRIAELEKNAGKLRGEWEEWKKNAAKEKAAAPATAPASAPASALDGNSDVIRSIFIRLGRLESEISQWKRKQDSVSEDL